MATGKTQEPSDFIAHVKDTCENLLGALQLPMKPEFHIDRIKVALTSLAVEARKSYIAMKNEDPWEE